MVKITKLARNADVHFKTMVFLVVNLTSTTPLPRITVTNCVATTPLHHCCVLPDLHWNATLNPALLGPAQYTVTQPHWSTGLVSCNHCSSGLEFSSGCDRLGTSSKPALCQVILGPTHGEILHYNLHPYCGQSTNRTTTPLYTPSLC